MDGRAKIFCNRITNALHSTTLRPLQTVEIAAQSVLLSDGRRDGKGGLAPSTVRWLPSFMLVPLVLLATIATIIASQSIITGAYSMT
jgi:K+ transporter